MRDPRARAAGWGGALAMCAAACVGACTRPSRAVDAGASTGAWGVEDDASVVEPVAQDDGGSIESGYQGPPVLLRNGRPIGFLRFVHIAHGAGRVRFIADSREGFEDAHLEATVEEGTTSGYLPTINVPHRVRVVVEGADGGVGADLVEPMLTDVYNNAGCTVALGGSAPWRARARRQHPEVRKLVRIVDIPRRDARTVGMLRLMSSYAGAWPVTIREGETTVYERLPFLTITGMRRIAPGSHAFALENPDGGSFAPEPVRVDLPGGEAHTLWIFGDRGRRADGAPRWILTNDVPPGRIGPAFTGEMPVYR
jgi:hypothetical protein